MTAACVSGMAPAHYAGTAAEMQTAPAGNRGLTPWCKQGAEMNDTAGPATSTAIDRIALIWSIAGHAQGRETEALREIEAALAGATLEELVALRTGGR